MNEKELLARSWIANAASWRDAVRQRKIASRRVATDAAVVEAVMRLAPRRVLDVGCGEGWLVRELAARGVEAWGVDASAPLIEAAKELGGGVFHALSYEQLAAGCADAAHVAEGEGGAGCQHHTSGIAAHDAGSEEWAGCPHHTGGIAAHAAGSEGWAGCPHHTSGIAAHEPEGEVSAGCPHHTEGWAGCPHHVSFDVAVANFALLEEDLGPVLTAVGRRLRPGGALVVQTVHPPSVTGDDPYVDGWRSETFAAIEGEWPQPMPWYFRTIGSWVRELAAHAFVIEDMREPLDEQQRKPLSMLFVCRFRA